MVVVGNIIKKNRSVKKIVFFVRVFELKKWYLTCLYEFVSGVWAIY